MNLSPGRIYLGKFSIVHNADIRARVNKVTLANNAIRELRNNLGSAITVHTGTMPNGVERSATFEIPVSNLLSPNDYQTDFLCRFTVNSQLDSARVDDVYGYAWNMTVGSPRLPSGVEGRAGVLFSRCSRFDTENRQGGWGFLQSHPYKQLCSEFTEIQSIDHGGTEAGSTAARVIANPITDSSSPAAIGTDPNDSVTAEGLARDVYGKVSEAVNSVVAPSGDGGVSANDIRFMMYAGVTILGLLVGARVLREVRKV